MNPMTITGTPGRPRAARRPRSWRAIATVTAAAAALAIGVALPVAPAVASGRSATVTSSVAAPAVPKYYVALNSPENAKSPDKAVVGDTLTGKRLATVSPPKGVTFGGVTGAADDRTFVLDGRPEAKSKCARRLHFRPVSVPGRQRHAVLDGGRKGTRVRLRPVADQRHDRQGTEPDRPRTRPARGQQGHP